MLTLAANADPIPEWAEHQVRGQYGSYGQQFPDLHAVRGEGTVINGIALGSDEFVKLETMRRTAKIVDNIEKIRAVFGRSTGEDGRQAMWRKLCYFSTQTLLDHMVQHTKPDLMTDAAAKFDRAIDKLVRDINPLPELQHSPARQYFDDLLDGTQRLPMRCNGMAIRSREELASCLLYTSPSPRDRTRSRMPSSA